MPSPTTDQGLISARDLAEIYYSTAAELLDLAEILAAAKNADKILTAVQIEKIAATMQRMLSRYLAEPHRSLGAAE
jgi:hypothetical protein